jgi:hypothetical protein
MPRGETWQARFSSELRSEVDSEQWTVDSEEYPRRWRALLLLPIGSEGVDKWTVVFVQASPEGSLDGVLGSSLSA